MKTRGMKVTRTTFNMLADVRRSKLTTVTLQKKLKNGKWGKPHEYKLYGCEKTAEEVIARLEENNPGDVWRIAE